MTEPATKPCEFCRNGTVTDSNGAAWRCAECNGTGVVPDLAPGKHACHEDCPCHPKIIEVEW